ncbi:hypothetical protein [Thaumasiovibrio sp. DFM-14]|uniref:hypothetical protein n=1 Tax=Thaumasiovibrio sp. DFM-14 TaxID=3384792 RepID=UPI0039A15158
MTAEIDFLIRLNEQGVVIHDEVASPAALIEEWLSTPVGAIYGRPEWGNRLALYRHNPVNPLTAMTIENSIMLKLPEDLPQLSIAAIKVTPIAHDVYKIAVGANGGVYASNVRM